MSVRIKLDLSKLTNELVFDSHFIRCQEDLNSELGWSEIQQAIMGKIEVLEEEYIDS